MVIILGSLESTEASGVGALSEATDHGPRAGRADARVGLAEGTHQPCRREWSISRQHSSSTMGWTGSIWSKSNTASKLVVPSVAA